MTQKPTKHRNHFKHVAFTHLDPPSTLAVLNEKTLVSMFKGVSRDKREKILSGVRSKGPPVGLYTPKYNFVLSDSPKGLVKFDSSPHRESKKP